MAPRREHSHMEFHSMFRIVSVVIYYKGPISLSQIMANNNNDNNNNLLICYIAPMNDQKCFTFTTY